MSRIELWLRGLAYVIGKKLMRWGEVSYCCHDGCRNPAVTSVPVEGEDFGLPVYAEVCAECVHKPIRMEIAQ